jgi:hypothetical protein
MLFTSLTHDGIVDAGGVIRSCVKSSDASGGISVLKGILYALLLDS